MNKDFNKLYGYGHRENLAGVDELSICLQLQPVMINPDSNSVPSFHRKQKPTVLLFEYCDLHCKHCQCYEGN